MSQSIASADTLSLSVDQCIAIALSDNPTIRIADMEIRRMDYSKKGIARTAAPINFVWSNLQPHARQADHVYEHAQLRRSLIRSRR